MRLKVDQRNPQCKHIAELTNAIQSEWRRLPQVHGTNRRVWELRRKHGGYTRYSVNMPA